MVPTSYTILDIIQLLIGTSDMCELVLMNLQCIHTYIHRYIERMAERVSSGGVDLNVSNREVVEWMHKIQEWDPKYFTLYHVPVKYRLYLSKFFKTCNNCSNG